MKYNVIADRTTKEYGTVTFEVEATSLEEAIEKVKNGDTEEVDWFVNKSDGHDENYRGKNIICTACKKPLKTDTNVCPYCTYELGCRPIMPGDETTFYVVDITPYLGYRVVYTGSPEDCLLWAKNNNREKVTKLYIPVEIESDIITSIISKTMVDAIKIHEESK